jgi:asparagine synthase (glutamine-hydrolysing)
MCGIFGIWPKKKLSPRYADTLIKNTWRNLRHRGPDGEGAFLWNEHGANILTSKSEPSKISPNLVFIHTRLAIQDTSSLGFQPMADSSSRFWIVFNGEIYNFNELARELSLRGVCLKSKSDTEVLIECWKIWGEDCISKLNGMFAFSIFDSLERKVYLVRDRVGIKPLYYSVDKNFNIIFSSEQSALINSGLLPIEANWDGVISGMLFQGALRPHTAYKNIQALKPGHYMVIDENKIRIHEYWDLEINQNEYTNTSAYIDKFKSITLKSIERTLISDVEVATLMSGGVDSSTMSAIASEMHPKISAYTLTWPDALNADNELKQAIMIAKKYPINHRVCTVDQNYLPLHLDEMFDLFEEPMGMFEPHFPIAELVGRDKVKVLLNGLGPDEMLGGYGYYKYISLWKRLHFFSSILKNIPISSGRLGRVLRLSSCKNPAEAYIDMFSGYLWNDPYEIFDNTLIPKGWNSIEHVKELYPNAWNFNDPIQTFNYLDLKLYIGTHHNHTTDKFLMNKSIEGRFPYLDHEWLDFSFNIPSKYKIQNHEQKWILRQLASKYINQEILAMPKKGFGMPEIAFIKNKYTQDWINLYINELKKRTVISPQVLKSLNVGKINSTKDARKLLYLASLEKWLQKIESLKLNSIHE